MTEAQRKARRLRVLGEATVSADPGETRPATRNGRADLHLAPGYFTGTTSGEPFVTI